MAAIAYRAAVGVAFAAAFLLVWVNVVQFADVNPAAVMYFGVPVVGIIGAAMARFQPDGMARALFATALAQALVLASALIIRNPQVTSWTPAVLRGFGLNAFFVMLFVGSALLFRKAASGGIRTGRGMTSCCRATAGFAFCFMSDALALPRLSTIVSSMPHHFPGSNPKGWQLVA